ncbi:1-acyl-sn-glycerol-3-phosphate acyltransferase [Enterobacterales bacterium CwR94]|nr:1-acyl-sn-glycerol-3-phosphate acyltransferase [Enterobacterales bacterium CwR94]
MLKKLLRNIFYYLVVWPVIRFWLGVRVYKLHALPQRGPAIIVANHNSHLDTFVLLSLFPKSVRNIFRPVAAADYFLKNRLSAWFTLNVLGIIPVERKGNGGNPLAACEQALAAGQIILIYPEGTRGDPDQLAPLKPGIWHLTSRFPDVPVIPIYLKGTGRVMGKGNRIPLPLFIDAHVDAPLPYSEDKQTYLEALQQRFMDLEHQGKELRK